MKQELVLEKIPAISNTILKLALIGGLMVMTIFGALTLCSLALSALH